MRRDELRKALQMVIRLRNRRAQISSRNRAWLANYLEGEAIALVEAGKRGRHGKYDERNYWLTMDYLFNEPTEKDLQSRWNLKARPHKILATWRYGCEGVLEHYALDFNWASAIEKYRAAYLRGTRSKKRGRSRDHLSTDFLMAAARADRRPVRPRNREN